MRTEDLQTAASCSNTSTGVGADGSHPRIPLNLSEETWGKIVVALAKVEQCGP